MMIIAIDIGGTKISAALMAAGKLIEQRRAKSIIGDDLTNLPDYLASLCHGWIEKAQSLAIACTGQVGIEDVHFLSAQQTLPLQALLRLKFNLPVVIINDAAAAALSEYLARIDNRHCQRYVHNRHGDKVGGDKNNIDKTLVYITVSTGIGGGIIQNGTLVTSTNGFCAHLGHTCVTHIGSPPIPCHCGRFNCAEAISSGTAIAKQASKILNKEVTCKEVFDHYLEVQEIQNLIDRCTSAIVDLIANIKAITGTERIVLGGSVSQAPIFWAQIKAKTAALPDIYQVCVESALCGADADVFGAYYYALETNAKVAANVREQACKL